MIIRFTNKWSMAINEMIDQGRRLGGLPSHIELSVEEATQIIDELNNKELGVSTPFHNLWKITTDSINSKLTLNKELNKDEKLQWLADWTARKTIVTFDGVPLQIVIIQQC